jgi:hypothetical protein
MKVSRRDNGVGFYDGIGDLIGREIFTLKFFGIDFMTIVLALAPKGGGADTPSMLEKRGLT